MGNWAKFLFFSFPWTSNSSLVSHLDHICIHRHIVYFIFTGPRLLTTVLLIKPFAVQRHLSKIFKRVLQEDFTIVAMRMLMLSPQQAAALVPSENRTNQVVSSMHVNHLMSGACLALCLLRENAVKKVLDLLGPENPVEAKRKNQFYWRGLYGSDLVNNGLHGKSRLRLNISLCLVSVLAKPVKLMLKPKPIQMTLWHFIYQQVKTNSGISCLQEFSDFFCFIASPISQLPISVNFLASINY